MQFPRLFSTSAWLLRSKDNYKTNTSDNPSDSSESEANAPESTTLKASKATSKISFNSYPAISQPTRMK
ncbi:hypothetical protein PRIPAC_93829 [Pristionchus pacificus]|uniref:Uncharacterized protein n=1 Tax=Pristionchus pacificus TaxID=54126 RepID=A0A2A6BQE9_PRIPA|nr:hypothetical protein PRIPAC_93829 [Pristionchus pacificus]|eukprot:PDM68172.1 hypothetical protein PRIPAC_46216 [Pristionchus pacificus]